MPEHHDSVLPDHKQIARYAASVFGGKPRVHEYMNRSETVSIGILSSPDRPTDGVTSYSTIKLSSHAMQLHGGEFPARIELAGISDNHVESFPNLLASAAFTIMQTSELYRPGTVIPDLVRQSQVSTTLPHLYLTAPFIWNEALNEFIVGSLKVTWLLAMPISDAEFRYVTSQGDTAFESLLEQHAVELSDPIRPSVV